MTTAERTKPEPLLFIENRIRLLVGDLGNEIVIDHIGDAIYSIDILEASRLPVDTLWYMPDRMQAYRSFRTYEYLKNDTFRMIFDLERK